MDDLVWTLLDLIWDFATFLNILLNCKAYSQGQRSYDGLAATDLATSFLDAGKLTFRDETWHSKMAQVLQFLKKSIDLHRELCEDVIVDLYRAASHRQGTGCGRLMQDDTKLH